MKRFAIVLVACAACGGKSSAIAELVKAEGPFDRAEHESDWSPAKPGATFALGDAARTGNGAAQLKLLERAQLALQANTILRFTGTRDRIQLVFAAGGGKLSGAGEYALSVGSVRLDERGELQITSTGIKLLAGGATRDVNGAVTNLKLDQEEPLDVTVTKARLVDAGVADASGPPPDAAEPPPDAGVDAAPDATVEVVSGLHVEVLPPGETKWTKVQGKVSLATGATIRVGDKSRARLVGGGATLELGSNSRAVVRDGFVFYVELGGGSAEAAREGKVGVPGGAVALKGSDAGAAQIALAVERNGEAKVKVVKPSATITGGKDGALELGRDESATLSRGGAIHPVDIIPSYFDVAIPAGESASLHDPRPPTAVKIDFGGKCPGGGVVELDRDGRFRAPRISRGQSSANVSITGSWAYRVRCGDDTGRIAATGRLAVVRDDGRRKLPATDPTFRIDDECRPITFDYQSQIPNFEFRAKPGGASYVLHLASAGDDKEFPASSTSVSVPAKQLHEGLYTFWWVRDGKQGCVSSLKLGYNNTVAQIYIQSPPNGQPFGSEVVVKGTVLTGFSAKVEGNELPMDGQHRFNATVPPPPGRALAIRLTHPKRGLYYYLCRP